MSRLSAFESMHYASLLGGKHDDFRTVFYALMSGETEDMDEAVEAVNQEPEKWSDDFRYDLEGLHSFRQFYGRRMSDYTPDQREILKAYDENWTYELVQKMLGHDFNADIDVPQVEPIVAPPQPEPTVH